MYKSGMVKIGLLALLSGCAEDCDGANQDIKHCVKPDADTVVEESNCNPDGAVMMRQAVQPDGTIHYVPMYMWYYGGGHAIPVGGHVTGGSFTPNVGRAYAPSSVHVSRGGFGTIGRSSFSGSSVGIGG